MNKNPIVAVKSFSLSMLQEAFAKGRFASARFLKNDGTVRVINGKSKILSALKGGEAAYDASSRGQLRVADVNLVNSKGERETGYRTVTAGKLLSLSANKTRYVLEGELKVKPEFINDVRRRGTDTLVKMNGKDVYSYSGVPMALAKNFAMAENRGHFFNENIKGKFDFVRLP